MESKSLRTYIRHIPTPKACCPQFGADLNTNNGLMVSGFLTPSSAPQPAKLCLSGSNWSLV